MPTIAVVDDDGAVSEVLREILEMRGHQVLLYPDGAPFLDAYEQDGIDLVITDLVMSMGGRTVVEKMAERGFPVPVVAIAGNMPNSVACELLAMGACDALQKPVGVEDLLRLVDKWSLRDVTAA